jgi:hypothetical protein
MSKGDRLWAPGEPDRARFSTTKIAVKNCEIIGESRAFAHQVVDPYPSDHRSVVATFEVP